MIHQEIIIIIIALIVVFMINNGNNRSTPTPTPTPMLTQRVFIPTTPLTNNIPDKSYGDLPGGMSGGMSGGSSGMPGGSSSMSSGSGGMSSGSGGMPGGMSSGSGGMPGGPSGSGGMSGSTSGGMPGGPSGSGGMSGSPSGSGGMSRGMPGGSGGPSSSGGMSRGMPGGSGGPNLPPLTKIPQSIKNILAEIGNKKPTESETLRFVNAVKDAIPNPRQLVIEVKNAPKDNNGKPILEEEKLQLYMLMVMVFMATEGKTYREEIGEEISKSYGAMPTNTPKNKV